MIPRHNISLYRPTQTVDFSFGIHIPRDKSCFNLKYLVGDYLCILQILLEVSWGGFVTEHELFCCCEWSNRDKPLFPALLGLLSGWWGAAGVRSFPLRAWRAGLWDHNRNTDEITGKAPRYGFRTSYILPAFRIQVLQVTELILMTSNRVSSIPKTNRWVDHKDPGLTGGVMICFAGQLVLTLSSMERGGPKRLLYQAHSLYSYSEQGQVLYYKLRTLEVELIGSLLPVLHIGLSKRWSGETWGRTLLRPGLFSLGPLSILTFSLSTLITDELFSARNIPPESLQTDLKSRLTNN